MQLKGVYVPSKDGHIFDKYIPSSIIDSSCFSFFQKISCYTFLIKRMFKSRVWFGFDFRSFYIARFFGYFQYDLIAVTSHRRQSYIFIDSVRAYKIPLMICKKNMVVGIVAWSMEFIIELSWWFMLHAIEQNIKFQ